MPNKSEVSENVLKFKDALDKAWSHVDFPDGGTYEEMYDAYSYAHGIACDALEKAIKLHEEAIEKGIN